MGKKPKGKSSKGKSNKPVKNVKQALRRASVSLRVEALRSSPKVAAEYIGDIAPGAGLLADDGDIDAASEELQDLGGSDVYHDSTSGVDHITYGTSLAAALAPEDELEDEHREAPYDEDYFDPSEPYDEDNPIDYGYASVEEARAIIPDLAWDYDASSFHLSSGEDPSTGKHYVEEKYVIITVDGKIIQGKIKFYGTEDRIGGAIMAANPEIDYEDVDEIIYGADADDWYDY